MIQYHCRDQSRDPCSKSSQKLSIIAQQEIRVIRDGVTQSVDAKSLVLDDLVVIGAGEQIPADMVVLSGQADVNESMLTGEADLVVKENDATLLSGSFVASGEVTAKVIRVGAENYAAKLSNEAKTHKPLRSELVSSIRKVTKFTSLVIVPLGVILFLQAYLFRGSDLKEAVIVSSAALLGMLPKGLVLLISIALTTGVIKLAKKDLSPRYVRDRDTGPCRYPLFRQNRHINGRSIIRRINPVNR